MEMGAPVFSGGFSTFLAFILLAASNSYVLYIILITERVKATLVEMGAPVFSGGFSTFLAFILLAASNSYVFKTFFKVSMAQCCFDVFLLKSKKVDSELCT